MNLEALFQLMADQNASDLHLATGMPPMLRRVGDLEKLDMPAVTAADFQSLLDQVLVEQQKTRFEKEMELEFSLSFKGRYRLRAALYRYFHGLAATFKLIPDKIFSIEQLGLPPTVKTFTRKGNGLILAVGPTGCGKSTTLTTMLDQINSERKGHIITIEDPIEFIHTTNHCFITQREIDTHTRSFAWALRSALREDPDVIMVGELRDYETMALALTAAETGHLVLATIHANNAIECLDRVISAFPPDHQLTARLQLSNTLVGIIFQALIPRPDRKARVCAAEVLVGTPAVKNMIREEKTHQLYSLMQTGVKDGMQSMEQSLRELQFKNLISAEEVSKRVRPKIALATA